MTKPACALQNRTTQQCTLGGISKHKWPQRKTKIITQRWASRRRRRRRRFARPSAKLRANIIPTSIPNDKKAEEKFKEISEANDVLSDEKKRKVYDQLGFYSDQIDPAQAEAYARQQGAGGGARWTSMASTFPDSRAAASSGPAGGSGLIVLGQLQRHFFRHLHRSAAAATAPRGPQPGTDLEYQATVDFWTAIRGGQARIQVTRQETCPDMPRDGADGRADDVSGVQRHRPGNADGRAHEVQYSLPALQRHGSSLKRLRDLPRRRHGEPHRDGGVPHQAGHARRAADPPAGQGQCRT